MVASQNGWRANDKSVISTRQVQGSNVKLAVRNGAPGDLLLMVAAAFDRFVDDIDAVADDWGYAERPIRGGTQLSNHASGTAIDLDATEHPLATDPHANFRPEQIAKIREIIAVTGNVVRWGGDYQGRKDGMHFEINDGRTEADCQRALDALRNWLGGAGAPPPVIVAGPAEYMRKGSRSAEVARWQNFLNKMYSRFRPPLVADGVFGDGTEARTKEVQQFLGLEADGVVGPKTKATTKF